MITLLFRRVVDFLSRMLAFRGAGGEPPRRYSRLRGLTQCHKDKITKNNIS
jgi:hypothetical protein